MYPAADILQAAASPGATASPTAAAAAAAALGSPRTPRLSSGRASPQPGHVWVDSPIMRKPSSSAGSILAVRSSGSFLAEGSALGALLCSSSHDMSIGQPLASYCILGW
jgi:hypothetical protein